MDEYMTGYSLCDAEGNPLLDEHGRQYYFYPEPRRVCMNTLSLAERDEREFRFDVGDLVTRPADVYAYGRGEDTPIMEGVVVRRYSTTEHDPDRLIYPEKELYEVLWFNYQHAWPSGELTPVQYLQVHRGYFRHGLDPAPEER